MIKQNKLPTGRTKFKRGSCIYTLVLYRNYDFAPIFLTLWIYPCVFKTKHHFTPIPPSSPNGVNFYTNDNYAHVILPLIFMVVCDFTPDLE